jgi:hypothetical protein
MLLHDTTLATAAKIKIQASKPDPWETHKTAGLTSHITKLNIADKGRFLNHKI